MKITIEVEPKEIAALVSELQERQTDILIDGKVIVDVVRNHVRCRSLGKSPTLEAL